MHCYEMILTRKTLSHVSIINISLEIMHTKLLKFEHKGHYSGNHGNHNN